MGGGFGGGGVHQVCSDCCQNKSQKATSGFPAQEAASCNSECGLDMATVFVCSRLMILTAGSGELNITHMNHVGV